MEVKEIRKLFLLCDYDYHQDDYHDYQDDYQDADLTCLWGAEGQRWQQRAAQKRGRRTWNICILIWVFMYVDDDIFVIFEWVIISIIMVMVIPSCANSADCSNRYWSLGIENVRTSSKSSWSSNWHNRHHHLCCNHHHHHNRKPPSL